MRKRHLPWQTVYVLPYQLCDVALRSQRTACDFADEAQVQGRNFPRAVNVGDGAKISDDAYRECGFLKGLTDCGVLG